MFEDMTPEGIKQEILSAAGSGWDTREGSFLSDLAAPIANQIWKVYQSLNALIPIAYVDESSGGYIDLRCAEFGITRKAGTRAQAQLAFTGQAGVVIPAGTAFLTPGGLEYDLAEDVTLTGSGGSGTVEAAQAGEAYNVEAGEIQTLLTNISGLETVTAGAATGGSDPESDGALVGRLYDRLKLTATSGNSASYVQLAKETDRVEHAKVQPLWAGPGTVKVLIAGSGKKPVDSTVVASCAAHIEEERPIGATVTVASVSPLTVNVAATVTVEASVTKSQVESAFEAVLEEYLQGLALQKYTILYNRVAFLLMDIPGVVDYSALTVNGGTADVAIGADQAPVLGEVSVT